MSRKTIFFVFGTIFIFYLFPLFSRTVSTDESVAILYIKTGFFEFFKNMLRYEVHPFLFFEIQRLIMGMLGTSIFSLRLEAIIFAIGSVFFVYRITRLDYDEKTSFFTAFFMMLSPFFIYYATEGRMYMQLLFFCVSSAYFLRMSIDQGRKRDFIAYFIFALGLLFTHVNAVFPFFIQFIYLLFYFFKKKLKKRDFLILLFMMMIAVSIYFVYCLNWKMFPIFNNMSDIMRTNSHFKVKRFDYIWKFISLMSSFFLSRGVTLMTWGKLIPTIIAVFLMLTSLLVLKRKEFSIFFLFMFPAILNFVFDSLLFIFYRIDLFEPKRLIFFVPFISLSLVRFIFMQQKSVIKRISLFFLSVIFIYFLSYSISYENSWSPYYEVKHFLKGKAFVKVDKDINATILYLYFPDSIKTIYCDDPKQNEPFEMATGINVEDSKELIPDKFHEVRSIIILQDEYMNTYLPKEKRMNELYLNISQYNRACEGYNIIFRKYSVINQKPNMNGYMEKLRFDPIFRIFGPKIGFRIEEGEHYREIMNYRERYITIFSDINFIITEFNYFKYYWFLPSETGFCWFRTIPLFKSYNSDFYFKPIRASIIFDPAVKLYVIILFMLQCIFSMLWLFDFSKKIEKQ